MKKIFTTAVLFVLVLAIAVSPVSAYNYSKINSIHYDWMDEHSFTDVELGINFLDSYREIIVLMLERYNVPDARKYRYAEYMWASYWAGYGLEGKLDRGIPEEFYDYFYGAFENAGAETFPLDNQNVYFDITDIYKEVSAENGICTVYAKACIVDRARDDATYCPVAMIAEKQTGNLISIQRFNPAASDNRYVDIEFEIPQFFDEEKHTLYIAALEHRPNGFAYDPPQECGEVIHALTEFDLGNMMGPGSGDADGNGKVNIADVTRTMKHLADWDYATINEALADTNGDGRVNLSDVSIMLQIIAGWYE